MPRFQVSYTTDTRPSDLPADAKVEQISTLPVEVNNGIGRTIKVTKSGDSLFIAVAERSGFNTIQARLTQEQAREIALGLLDGKGLSVPAGRDRKQGDRVRLDNNDTGYTNRDIPVGTLGTVDGPIDFDGDYWVKFDNGISDYVKHGQLVLA